MPDASCRLPSKRNLIGQENLNPGRIIPFLRVNLIQTSNEVKRSELGGNQGKYSQGNEWTGDSAPEKVFFSSGEIRTEHFQISS